MGWRSQRVGSFWIMAIVGAGAAAGLAAGLSAEPQQANPAKSQPSPAEIVATRFAAANTIDAPAATGAVQAFPQTAAPSSGYVLASADSASASLFNPYPTYRIYPEAAAADTAPANASPAASPSNSPSATAQAARTATVATNAPASNAPSQPATRGLPPQLANADDQIPAGALAYATPTADEPTAAATPANNAAAPKRASAPAHPATSSNAVLNNAQIASIRERLKLSSYQDQLWPPVESALKDISWQRDPSGRKGAGHATIDPNSASVQRLKSAAFPLIMSLSSDQKEEVRTMVRLMGLENLAAEF